MEFVKSRLDERSKENINEILIEEITKDLNEKIELFDKFLCIPKKDKRIEGLNEILEEGLYQLANDSSEKDALLKISQLEQLAKGLLLLVDENKYNEIVNGKNVLANTIIFLNPRPKNLEEDKDWIVSRSGKLNLILFPNEKEIGMKLKDKFSGMHLHWARAYNHRNIDAHDCQKLSKLKIYTEIESKLYVYIELIWKYKNEIEKIYESYNLQNMLDIDKYRENIIIEYEREGKEKSFVISQIGKISDDINNDDLESPKGAIDCVDILNFKNQDEKHIQIVGEAGLGKTRILEHLEYLNAKDGEKTIPVYIPLYTILDNDLGIKGEIAKKLKVDKDDCEILMQSGKLNIYLDGLNEIISNDLRRIVALQIEKLLDENENNLIVLTDRENSRISIKNMTTYLIKKMDTKMAKEFIDLNVKSKKTGTKIKSEIQNNEFMRNIFSNPYMLKELIEIVEKTNKMPNVKTDFQLTKFFVDELIKREWDEKRDSKAQHIDLLLTDLAIIFAMEEEELTQEEVLNEFTSTKMNHGLEKQGIDYLELITQMGFLKINENKKIAYSNPKYQEYFRAKFLIRRKGQNLNES